ncbi:MAG TPA: hypothetical protein VLJ10_02805, partial [Candidatus Bathyarchaeia archaeon]|nr:hypothetical protein [Candidatus Bathyarchaeia archaeon]
MMKRVIASFLVCVYLLTLPVQMGLAQIFAPMPPAGQLVGPGPAFMPPLLIGLEVDPKNPLQLDFFVSPGQAQMQPASRQAEYQKLLQYFYAALTVPESHLWVNLSPTEKDRIIEEDLAKTRMGMDLLAQDYFLKQLSSSLVNPENETGAEFWRTIRSEMKEKYGTDQLPADLLNRVWVVPEKAVVYQEKGRAWVVYSRLKVMLEEDYDTLRTNIGSPVPQIPSPPAKTGELLNGGTAGAPGNRGTGALTKEIMRNILIPALEKEVNEGESFSTLRQMVNAMVLAEWFKRQLRTSVFGKAYVDQSKMAGIDSEDEQKKWDIYNQYLKSFQGGAYDFIKEEIDQTTGEMIPRRYFSGGFGANLQTAVVTADDLTQLPLWARIRVREQLIKQQHYGLNKVRSRAEVVKKGERRTPAYRQGREDGERKADTVLDTDTAMLAATQPAAVKDYSKAAFPEMLADYFNLFESMIAALDNEDDDEYRRLHAQMVSLVEPIAQKSKTVSDDQLLKTAKAVILENNISPEASGENVVKDEKGYIRHLRLKFEQLSAREYPAQTRAMIDRAIEEVAEELYYDDPVKKKALIEQFQRDIRPMHFLEQFPVEMIQGDLSNKREQIVGVLRNFSNFVASYGFFDHLTEAVFVRPGFDDEDLAWISLKHEMIHYMAAKGIIKVPAAWEDLAYAVTIMEHIKLAKRKGITDIRGY